MFKIADKEWPDYFTSYRTYIKNTHSYTNTRLSSNNALTVPKCRSNAGLRTFYASATRLWNRVDDNELKPWQAMTNESNSKKHLLKRLNINASGKHLFFLSRLYCAKGHTYTTAWPVPHTCTKPYHSGSGSQGQLFRPYRSPSAWHGIAVGSMNGENPRVSKTLYCRGECKHSTQHMWYWPGRGLVYVCPLLYVCLLDQLDSYF